MSAIPSELPDEYQPAVRAAGSAARRLPLHEAADGKLCKRGLATAAVQSRRLQLEDSRRYLANGVFSRLDPATAARSSRAGLCEVVAGRRSTHSKPTVGVKRLSCRTGGLTSVTDGED